ncbi:hypothetical protein [Paenibacillus sp. OAS669]|uniref:hypothetical protein n=1 Tax=Paenibacillus sp. OAS669 TaxID=2663821 RepID=UPI0017890FDC|nr:hypothetical protein [Paenibacillus sp. OAS669]MBE1445637.1 hypothetical protein [Paenibacillus sp. OAS669]
MISEKKPDEALLWMRGCRLAENSRKKAPFGAGVVEKPENLQNCFGTPVGYPPPAAVVLGKI